MMKKTNRVTLFLVLTFTLSYGLAAIFYLAGGRYSNGTVWPTVMAISYMFMPMISVLIVEKLIHREKIARKYNISFKFNGWFLVAWMLPLFIGFLSMGVALLFPDIGFSKEMKGMFDRFDHMMTEEQINQMKASMESLPMHPLWLSVLQGLLAGATVNAVAGFGEELGWRGFLLKQFNKMSFLKASLIIGFIWGIWHAPLILMGHNYPQHPYIGVLMMVIWCILLAFLFNYITIKAKSVIAASVLHGTLNGTAGIAIMMLVGGSDLLVGITGLAGFIALALTLLGVFLYDKLVSKDQIMSKKTIPF